MSKKFLTPVQLPADPTQPLEAVTKQYVDARAGSEVEINASDPIGTSPGAELWYDTDDPSGGVVTPAFDGTPSPVGVSGSAGTLANWARGDHVHAASAYTSYNGPPAPLGVVAAPGSSTSWARGDHIHPMPIAAGRNLLDNSQMVVKQRAATTVALTTTTQVLADRWNLSNSGVGATNMVYATLAAFGATTPTGRPKPANVQYIIMTTAEAAGALASSDYMQWAQNMEGQFLQHLNWGTADAQPVVLSFDIYSTIATSYVAELYRYETAVRSISRLVTVPVGWSTQVVTFPGDTVNAITNDNAQRLQVGINLVGGSLFTSGGTLQTSWGAVSNGNRWPGISNAIQATVSNVVSVTNVQFEIGTVPTPYEVRRFDDETQACLRYYYESYKGSYATVPSAGVIISATQAYVNVFPPVRMRAVPTPSYIGNMRIIDQAGASGWVISGVTDPGSAQCTPDAMYVIATINGGTVGRPVFMQANSDPTAALRLNAEI